MNNIQKAISAAKADFGGIVNKANGKFAYEKIVVPGFTKYGRGEFSTIAEASKARSDAIAFYALVGMGYSLKQAQGAIRKLSEGNFKGKTEQKVKAAMNLLYGESV